MDNENYTAHKTCTRCNETKPATEEFFDKYKCRGKYLQRRFCRVCIRARDRAYRAANAEKVAEWDRRNYERNKAAGSEFQKRRYAAKDKNAARDELKKWKADNPEKVRAMEVARNERIKARRLVDPEFREKLNKKARDWRRNKKATDPEFREKEYAKNRAWQKENKEWGREAGRRKRERMKNDPSARLISSIRSRVRHALKEGSVSQSITALIGASVDVVRDHIEAQFKDGMTWDNWGRGWDGAKEWHIDHIRPLASFDLTDPEQLSLACNYKNLQPLWVEDNLKKGSSYGVRSGGRKP